MGSLQPIYEDAAPRESSRSSSYASTPFIYTLLTAMSKTPRRQRASVLLLVCILLSTGALLTLGSGRPARAQQADAPEKDTTVHVETKTRKSPTRAQLYSFGGTLVPILLGAGMDSERDDVRVPLWVTGIFIGPSVGHFYADNASQALTGIGIRLGGGALGILGFLSALDASLEGNSDYGGAAFLYGIGGLTVLISGGYDIFTADDAARDYNEVHGLKARVGPAVGSQGEQVGLSLQIQF